MYERYINLVSKNLLKSIYKAQANIDTIKFIIKNKDLFKDDEEYTKLVINKFLFKLLANLAEIQFYLYVLKRLMKKWQKAGIK